MSRRLRRVVADRWIALVAVVAVLGLLQLAGAGAAPDPAKKKPKPDFVFQLVSANNCLANVSGTGQIFKQGNVEKLVLTIQGLPANTEFDTFIIQQPTNPFGLSWYQGDISTGKTGSGTQDYSGPHLPCRRLVQRAGRRRRRGLSRHGDAVQWRSHGRHPDLAHRRRQWARSAGASPVTSATFPRTAPPPTFNG